MFDVYDDECIIIYRFDVVKYFGLMWVIMNVLCKWDNFYVGYFMCGLG